MLGFQFRNCTTATLIVFVEQELASDSLACCQLVPMRIFLKFAHHVAFAGTFLRVHPAGTHTGAVKLQSSLPIAAWRSPVVTLYAWERSLQLVRILEGWISCPWHVLLMAPVPFTAVLFIE